MFAPRDFYGTFLGRMFREIGMTIVPVLNPADVGYEIDGQGAVADRPADGSLNRRHRWRGAAKMPQTGYDQSIPAASRPLTNRCSAAWFLVG